MRYAIVNNQVKSSIFIDAPYDTIADAIADQNAGITHNCTQCAGDPEKCPENDAMGPLTPFFVNYSGVNRA